MKYLGITELLAQYPIPATLRRAGKSRVETLLRKHAPKMRQGWARHITLALAAQSVVDSGTEGPEPFGPNSPPPKPEPRTSVMARVEALVNDYPLQLLLKAIPDIVTRTQRNFPRGALATSHLLLEKITTAILSSQTPCARSNS
jgi:hypothetical protein